MNLKMLMRIKLQYRKPVECQQNNQLDIKKETIYQIQLKLTVYEQAINVI